MNQTKQILNKEKYIFKNDNTHVALHLPAQSLKLLSRKQ